jgi:tetratricopeptide (TPR) repeat protein
MDLVSCRILQDRVVQLQKVAFDAQDPVDQGLRARQLHNSGNLECAEGNWNTAIENYISSSALRETSLQSPIEGYGRTHLCLGRAYYFKGEWDSAREHYRRAANFFDQDPIRSSAWIAQ